MKKIKCKDLGMKCKFVAEGRTDASTKNKMNAHGKKVHKEALMGMTKTQMKAMDKKMDGILAKQDVKK